MFHSLLSLTTTRQLAAALAWAMLMPVHSWAQIAVTPTPVLQLRIVGGLAGVNQYTRNEQPFWTSTLARLSQGKYSATIVPFDQAGVSGGDMLRLLELGVVPFGTALLSSITQQHPQFGALDLAGLNPDMASLKKNAAGFRPFLEQELRSKHNIQMLALYVYPAQVIFCKQPFTGLTDLKARSVRVSSATQADFVRALGAQPVAIDFAQLKANLVSGNIDCAITGTMSGNTLGLHTIASHVHTLPITWGLAIFAANKNAWDALPPELRVLLAQELPRLESAIWRESELETAEGMACNTGADTCRSGSKGHMQQVASSPADERVRQSVLQNTVLPRWLARCKAVCPALWNQSMAHTSHIQIAPS